MFFTKHYDKNNLDKKERIARNTNKKISHFKDKKRLKYLFTTN